MTSPRLTRSVLTARRTGKYRRVALGALVSALAVAPPATAGTLEVVPAGGGRSTVIAEHPLITGHRWSADGAALLAVSLSGETVSPDLALRRFPLDGGPSSLVRRLRGGRPLPSPDGSLVMEPRGGRRRSTIVVREAATGRVTARVAVAIPRSVLQVDGIGAAWSRDGRRLAVSGRALSGGSLTVLDAATGAVLLRRRMPAAVRDGSFSPDGERLVVGLVDLDAPAGLAIVDLRSRRVRRLPDWGHADASDLAWSPDGATIAAADDDGIGLVDPVTGWGPSFPLAAGKETIYRGGLTWSPDGRTLAYVVDFDLSGRRTDLVTLDVQPRPSPARVLVSRRNGFLGDPEYSPAGDRIAFSFGPL